MDDQLRAAYEQMSMIRAVEDACMALSIEGFAAGSMHLCLGQEAIPVGAVSALADTDRITTTYRGHGWAVARGVPIETLLAEICHKEAGLNGGRGGSAHFFAPDHGLYGENSIVGAGVPISAGLAMASASQGNSVVLTSIGDGAMNQGSTYEGLVFAKTRQLPLIVMCENNGWAEMTPASEMTRHPYADRVAAMGIKVIHVDGCDPTAVHDAVAQGRQVAISGHGPVFIECATVRLSGHYNRDIEHYRPATDKRAAAARDPLVLFRERFPAEVNLLGQIDEQVSERVGRAVEVVQGLPDADPATALAHVHATTDAGTGRVDSEATSAKSMTYQMAVNTAMRQELESRPTLRIYGEDVGAAGGIFGVTRRLQRDFGAERVFDTPIAESAILGSAVGAAMGGLLPVVEIMWADFMLVALDQLINQAANVRYVSRGRLSAPMVVRTQQGVTPGSCAQHSQSLEALLAHVPGLKVGLPSTPNDAHAMLRAAIADPDPCVLIESRSLYQTEGLVHAEAPLESAEGARWRRRGDDLGIITWGAIAPKAEEAAEKLAQRGVEASVLDLRWLNPLDDQMIDTLVEATGGRVLIVHEANLTGGFGTEVAARIQDRHHGRLAAPVKRLGVPDSRIPAAPTLQAALVPGVHDIIAAAEELVEMSLRAGDRGSRPVALGLTGSIRS